jgi:hypothetical protein
MMLLGEKKQSQNARKEEKNENVENTLKITSFL